MTGSCRMVVAALSTTQKELGKDLWRLQNAWAIRCTGLVRSTSRLCSTRVAFRWQSLRHRVADILSNGISPSGSAFSREMMSHGLTSPCVPFGWDRQTRTMSSTFTALGWYSPRIDLWRFFCNARVQALALDTGMWL